MEDIEKIFSQENGKFTVFVVEQRFAVQKGRKYFESFKNTSNFLTTDEQINNVFKKIFGIIEKNVAPVSKLIRMFTEGFSLSNITEVISDLCKLFTVNEHQVAGPDVIDPIIFQEGKVTKRMLTKIITLHRESILRPVIIIILKDNNFERAKDLLKDCPDGILVKFVYNSGKEETYKIVNAGAENLDSFINAFSEQCYTTCSNTERNILINSDWAGDSISKLYVPTILRYRTNLLYDQKEEIKDDLAKFVDEISKISGDNTDNEKLIRSFECITKLYRVFCNDFGGKDIIDAQKIASSLNNELLLAQVYRYAYFLPNCSFDLKQELYEKGYSIFQKNQMEDCAIYCKNNQLVEEFYTDYVHPERFYNLQQEAMSNVPGMIGMSHILNNVGVAYTYCGQADKAIDFFNIGIQYANENNRIVQNLALKSNKIIAECYSGINVEQTEMILLLKQIMDGMGLCKLPFLAADYALNVISVAYHQNPKFAKELTSIFPIKDLIEKAFEVNPMGASHRILQLQYLNTKYGDSFTLLDECKIPANTANSMGKRRDFILKYGFNLFDFETWL